MPSKRQDRIFTKQKCDALEGLLNALADKRIPDSTVQCPPSERYLTTGNIIERLDYRYRHVTKRAMLEALRDVDVPHDSNNRFTAWRLHSYKGKNYGRIFRVHRFSIRRAEEARS